MIYPTQNYYQPYSYNQTPYQIPNYSQQPQQMVGNYMSGKIIQRPEDITANDVPMDGSNEDYNKMRDMDKRMGRMYYTDSNSMPMSGNTNVMDSREGKAGKSRVKYYESKATNDKQMKMQKLEDYLKDMSEDLTEMIVDASPEEKMMAKQKMQILMQKM